jgi:hypothetical protein
MARTVRRPGVKEVALSEIKDDLSRYLRDAETQEIVGFGSEEDRFDYRLEHDPRFLKRIEQARDSLRDGRGVRLEDVEREQPAFAEPAPPRLSSFPWADPLMMFLTMNGARRIFTTKGTKFARRTGSADVLCASLVLFVVNSFDPLAGQGMSA